MGYYVSIINSTASIRAQDLDRAYEVLCKLNERDDLKTGRSWGGGVAQRHFAWMSANYPAKNCSAREILEELGFDIDEDEHGLQILSYDSKSGDEEVFIRALAEAGLIHGEIEWVGEEGARWRWVMANNSFTEQVGKVVYE